MFRCHAAIDTPAARRLPPRQTPCLQPPAYFRHTLLLMPYATYAARCFAIHSSLPPYADFRAEALHRLSPRRHADILPLRVFSHFAPTANIIELRYATLIIFAAFRHAVIAAAEADYADADIR